MGKGTGPAPENLGGTAIKPVGWDRTGLEAFKYLLYNPETGEVLTRTPLSWLKITVFYTIYYSFLAAFWLGCLNIFFLTLPEIQEGPKWTQGASIIGVNPGVGLRPLNTDELIDSQMFILKHGDTNNVTSDDEGQGNLNIDYAARLQKFLKVYDTKATEPYKNFDVETELGGCGKWPFGYIMDGDTQVEPCIFVKFNKIWDWEPTVIDIANEEDLANLPTELQTHINDQDDKENVWVNCAGRYPADQEALKGQIEYFPKSRAIPKGYFPYTGGLAVSGKNYHSPLVAIKIKPTPATIGQLVHVECRAYFHGVKHDTKHKLGLVQFEVMITDH
jgi:sodium/potassium-transporting ATPase subunit beta